MMSRLTKTQLAFRFAIVVAGGTVAMPTLTIATLTSRVPEIP